MSIVYREDQLPARRDEPGSFSSAVDAFSPRYNRMCYDPEFWDVTAAEFLHSITDDGGEKLTGYFEKFGNDALWAAWACLLSRYFDPKIEKELRSPWLQPFPLKQIVKRLPNVRSAAEVFAALRESGMRLGDASDSNTYANTDVIERLMLLVNSEEYKELRPTFDSKYIEAAAQDYLDARARAATSASLRRIAYADLTTGQVIAARGMSGLVVSVLGLFSWIVLAFQFVAGHGMAIISSAAAQQRGEHSPPTATATAFVPPWGISPQDWRYMVIVLFAVVIFVSLAFIWKGILAKDKSELAASLAERIATLVIGAVVGKSIG